MGVIAFIQARMGSTRLPGKVLLDLGGRPVLGWAIRAAQASDLVDDVVVATSTDAADDPIVALCDSLEVATYRGHPDDVLDRYIGALTAHPSDPVVRLTADCPLLDPNVISRTIAAWRPGLDYVSTALVPHLPLGFNVEVASAAALRKAHEEAEGVDRVHVTSYLYRKPGRFAALPVVVGVDGSHYRVTLDTSADLEALRAIVDVLGDRPPSVAGVVALLDERPDIVAINRAVHQKRIEEG